MGRTDISSVVTLLRELIAVPSINPAFAPGFDAFAREQRVAEFIAATAATAGLDVELQEVHEGRPNVLARLTPHGPVRRRLLLAPHLDTVGATTIDNRLFDPIARGGRLHGRGACDTKGSAAAMLTALMQLARSGKRPAETEIVFAGLVDEENGQLGSRALVKRGMKADLAIVGEPTQLEVVTAHKGDLWLQFETRGKSAHGSMPHLGRNAVHLMARLVNLLETTYASALKRRRHPLLGSPTVNVGTIEGGTQPNIVPAHCWISVDRRMIPGETERAVRREMQLLLRRHRLAATMLNIRAAACPPLETDPELPLVKQFLHSTGRRRSRGVHYFCDAAVLSAGGIPSVVFGPGNIAQAHTADEWISVRSLEAGTTLLKRFLESMP